jgi:hypothetical protein
MPHALLRLLLRAVYGLRGAHRLTTACQESHNVFQGGVVLVVVLSAGLPASLHWHKQMPSWQV